MPEIMIEPELYKRVEKAALEQEISTNDIFSEAVRQYLWELNRRKISEETRIYRQQHEQLKATYLGHYIAMFHGQVVDQDEDFQVLHRRIRQQYGQQPVMITLVEETADPVLTRHGFRLGPNKIRLSINGPERFTDIRSQ